VTERPKPRIHIEYMTLESTEPDPLNPKDHSLSDLAESVERFGFVSPGAINEETGKLIYGHGRRELLLAMRNAGQQPPPGVLVGDDGTWRWPVIRGFHLRPGEDIAYVIADNRLVEAGGWNRETLVRVLTEAGETSARDNLAGTGFDLEDLERLQELIKGRPSFFDASKLGETDGLNLGSEQAGDGLRRSYIVYITFDSVEQLGRALAFLSGGTRKAGDQRYAHIDGMSQLERWRGVFADLAVAKGA